MFSFVPIQGIGFFGGRRLGRPAAWLAAQAGRLAAGRRLVVPVPSGPGSVSSFVLEAVGRGPGVSVIYGAVGHGPAGLVSRAFESCRELAAGPSPLAVVFPGVPCPAAPPVRLRRWSSCGSGSWSEAALALGFAVPVLLVGEMASSAPASWGAERVNVPWPVAAAEFALPEPPSFLVRPPAGLRQFQLFS